MKRQIPLVTIDGETYNNSFGLYRDSNFQHIVSYDWERFRTVDIDMNDPALRCLRVLSILGHMQDPIFFPTLLKKANMAQHPPYANVTPYDVIKALNIVHKQTRYRKGIGQTPEKIAGDAQMLNDELEDLVIRAIQEKPEELGLVNASGQPLYRIPGLERVVIKNVPLFLGAMAIPLTMDVFDPYRARSGLPLSGGTCLPANIKAIEESGHSLLEFAHMDTITFLGLRGKHLTLEDKARLFSEKLIPKLEGIVSLIGIQQRTEELQQVYFRIARGPETTSSYQEGSRMRGTADYRALLYAFFVAGEEGFFSTMLWDIYDTFAQIATKMYGKKIEEKIAGGMDDRFFNEVLMNNNYWKELASPFLNDEANRRMMKFIYEAHPQDESCSVRRFLQMQPRLRTKGDRERYSKLGFPLVRPDDIYRDYTTVYREILVFCMHLEQELGKCGAGGVHRKVEQIRVGYGGVPNRNYLDRVLQMAISFRDQGLFPPGSLIYYI